MTVIVILVKFNEHGLNIFNHISFYLLMSGVILHEKIWYYL